ncbi:MAG: InlB B-repeat-containing protein, partial [Oscillospiraceae bacterium]|nr:InlB B-repeat-containing protein [Oscillospiraceae bacterium]
DVDADHSPYAYQVVEDQDMAEGFIPDPNAYPVTITVAPNADGLLTVTIDPPLGGIVLTNTYNPAAVDANFSAEKLGVGKPLEDSQFTFGLYDGDTPVSIGTNAADGTVTFQPITYAETGSHQYTMREISGGGDGWTTDSAEYAVVVNITDDGSGALSAEVVYPDGFPSFTNTYAAESISVVLSATKAAVGRALSGGEFSFGVYEGDTLITSATNAADGTIIFPEIVYAGAGTHNYTIREITQSGNGWTTDAAEYPATVTITDDGEGNLSADVAYPGGTPAFTNTYALSPANVTLSATKLAFGKALTADAFTFGVYDNAGNLKASAMNAADGTISYPPITFNAPGTYYYYLQEITPSGNGWTTDTRKDPVVITVTDNGAGALVANVLYPFGAASFRNQYGASPAIVIPTATKTASGAALPAGRFTFGLYNHQTGALVDTASNTGSGNITFKNLSFSAPGTYTYQVKEITPSTGGWTSDATVFTAVITVTDDGSGQLQSSIAFSPAAPSFHNSYDPSDTTEDIYGYKVLNNWDGEEVAFDFALTELDGTVVATAQNSQGVIHFTTAALTSPGTYNYIMKETSESGDGWTTDAATFPVTVTVLDGGQGKLLTTVDYPDGTPTFINSYQTTPASLELTATKAAIGKALAGNDFIFGLFDENGDIQASAYNDADGNIAFPAVTFDQAGTFTYTVRELSPDKEGWVTDKNTYPVTIEVVDNGDGTFSIGTVRYVRGMPTFTNTYTCTPATATLYAAKYATGKAMAGNDFDFVVEDAAGNVKAVAKNDSHGSVSFPAIVFDQPGVYNYTVLESTAPGNGWNTDTTLIPVTITVTDNGQGALDAAIAYPDGVPHFYNAYSENTVRFQSNGGTPVPNQQVPFGNPAQRPSDPTRDGYSFCGWFADAELTIPYDFSQAVTAPITLYACWTQIRDTYSVAFDSNGGSPVDTQFVLEGETADRPDDPTRTGYTFGGWYSDAGLTMPYDFSRPVTGDMTLYARWIGANHTVIFDSNGGSAIPPQQVRDGQPIQQPADPTRPGYNFCGWFADAALTIPYDFSQPVYGDVTLYACWSRRAYSVPTGRKVLQGAQMTAGQFAFRLTDENGVTIGMATNDAAGNIRFDSGAFAPGTHVYTLQEVVQSAALYFQYDLRPRQITVTVSRSGDVTLMPMPTFVNRYVGWNVDGGRNKLWTGGDCCR